MNAPLPEGVARVPRRSDYEPIVKGLRPFIEGEELTLRSSLLLMRDRAMATKPHVSEYAWLLLDVVQQVATEHALNQRVPVDALREMRRLCLNVIASASSFNTLNRSLPSDEPEAA